MEELSQVWVTLCMPFLLSSLLLSWGVFQHESVYPPSLFPKFLHVLICQEVVQACKATTSYPKVGLVSRSTNIQQQPPVEEGLAGWSLGRPVLGLGALFHLCDVCPCMCSLLFASQQPGFVHIFSLLSADLFLISVIFSLGRKLRGKAFYFVNGKVFCEEDFLVSTQLTLVMRHLSVTSRLRAFLPVGFACVSHTSGLAPCLALLLQHFPRASPSHAGCPHVVLQVVE